MKSFLQWLNEGPVSDRLYHGRDYRQNMLPKSNSGAEGRLYIPPQNNTVKGTSWSPFDTTPEPELPQPSNQINRRSEIWAKSKLLKAIEMANPEQLMAMVQKLGLK